MQAGVHLHLRARGESDRVADVGGGASDGGHVEEFPSGLILLSPLSMRRSPRRTVSSSVTSMGPDRDRRVVGAGDGDRERGGRGLVGAGDGDGERGRRGRACIVPHCVGEDVGRSLALLERLRVGIGVV